MNIYRFGYTDPEGKVYEFTELFRMNVKNNEKENEKMPPNNNDVLRIMTWNVRYFTNIKDKPTFKEIVEVIRKIDPDILCLNETSLGRNQYYTISDVPLKLQNYPDITKELEDYEVISMCNMVPSWFTSFYGNIIFVKKNIMKNLRDQLDMTYLNICNVNRRCFLNQYIQIFKEPEIKKEKKSGADIEMTNSNHELRCFIKISLVNFDIIFTHLDAYNKNIREAQFRELMDHATRDTIIIGDLNMINTMTYFTKKGEEYVIEKGKETEWKQIVRKNMMSNNPEESDIVKFKKEYQLRDSFEIIRQDFRGFTTWTNTIVDYFLFKKNILEWDKIVKNSFVYYTDLTDHLPLIIDLQMEELSYNYKEIPLEYKENAPNLKELSLKEQKEEQKKEELTFEELNKKILDEPKIYVHTYEGKITFFNVEPILAYDWFLDGHVNIARNYNFEDPYMTGNYNLFLGNNGVYTSISLIEYAYVFHDPLVNRTRLENKYKKLGILYRFNVKEKNENEVKIIDITFSHTPYTSNLDKEYDIIKNGEIVKLTNRLYDEGTGRHNIFELSQIYLVTLMKPGWEKLLYTVINQDEAMKVLYEGLQYIKELEKEKRNTFPLNDVFQYTPEMIKNNLNIFYSANMKETYFCLSLWDLKTYNKIEPKILRQKKLKHKYIKYKTKYLLLKEKAENIHRNNNLH
jgi:endonuclease/exonuclease/phosphatase family metal-dependent hydrolase